MASANVVVLTDQNFDQEISQSKGAALVDFWAEWCMPCKMLSPIIDELADQYPGKLKVGKVETEPGSRQVTLRFKVESIPTIILFRDGQMVKKFIGRQEKRVLKAAIDDLLAGK
jgi:thioredoxin 1